MALKQTDRPQVIKIYILRHPITHEIQYVGKTKLSVERRLEQHIKKKKIKFNIEIIDYCSIGEWPQKELYWTKYFIKQGNRLLNIKNNANVNI